MATKRGLELDERVRQIIDEEFADYERYLPNIQDVAQYRRKRKEYWDKVSARIKEDYSNGRTDESAITPAVAVSI